MRAHLGQHVTMFQLTEMATLFDPSRLTLAYWFTCILTVNLLAENTILITGSIWFPIVKYLIN